MILKRTSHEVAPQQNHHQQLPVYKPGTLQTEWGEQAQLPLGTPRLFRHTSGSRQRMSATTWPLGVARSSLIWWFPWTLLFPFPPGLHGPWAPLHFWSAPPIYFFLLLLPDFTIWDISREWKQSSKQFVGRGTFYPREVKCWSPIVTRRTSNVQRGWGNDSCPPKRTFPSLDSSTAPEQMNASLHVWYCLFRDLESTPL